VDIGKGEQVIATKTVVVRDEAMQVDRQVIAGQAVPFDLLEAYEAATAEVKAPGKAAKAGE
jgi:hypothetical protein